jgi:UDP-N-acetylglucosamine 1-carboxyvinyltransferase
MAKICITGPARLNGTVAISGAKNAALPCLAASLLSNAPVILHNIPPVKDVETMNALLAYIGADIQNPGAGHYALHCTTINKPEAPYDMVKTMRASILVLGPLLARNGYVRVSLPGGCAIGARPVDLHLKGLEKLGAQIQIEHGYIIARTDRLKGAEYSFDKVTVTGTENIMMAACLADNETVLYNCAREPEIENLAELLVSMGAQIDGIGTDCLRITGVSSLHQASHHIIPDRIETGTYAIAAAACGENVIITNCCPQHVLSPLKKLEEVGANIKIQEHSIHIIVEKELQSIDIETNPYPGFPTDLQAQYMALMTQANSTCLIKENIFENRFMHVGELQRMGADIHVNGAIAKIKGKTLLTGALVMATDLRASACLVIAGLAAQGETIIDRMYHLERGYSNLIEKLQNLGAKIGVRS